MGSTPVIVIFDIGKTNKKVLVFDAALNVIHERSEHLPESLDDDGYPCEDVQRLTNWVETQWEELNATDEWIVKAVNVSAYGASFVHLGKDGSPSTPLYNYLKPFPRGIRAAFHKAYPGIWAATASPDLDNLNSGLQLFMIKHGKPGLFVRIERSLHLPQYISYILSGQQHSELTSIGCHTAMWDFRRFAYHSWIAAEGLASLQADIQPSDTVIEIKGKKGIIYSGIGLHDSSAALIPYLATQTEPFCLLSTGTWSITLNPSNHTPLTEAELAKDALCYLSYEGKPVKASRLFLGHFHDLQAARLAEHFHKPAEHYKSSSTGDLLKAIGNKPLRSIALPFEPFDPATFSNYELAYAHLIEELVARQVSSTNLVLSREITSIFVDGGFSNNSLFMTLLARAYPKCRVYSASIAQASAIGSAMAIHKIWTGVVPPADILKLKSY